jgi:hypothetical protein
MRVKVYFFPTERNEESKSYDLNTGATVADLRRTIKNDSAAPALYQAASAIEITDDPPGGVLPDAQQLEDNDQYLAKVSGTQAA